MHVVCIIILEYTTRQRNCNGSPALEKNTIQFLVSTMQLMEAALLKACRADDKAYGWALLSQAAFAFAFQVRRGPCLGFAQSGSTPTSKSRLGFAC